jgi:hypothetical protein
MVDFLKLAFIIINITSIRKITIKEDKFSIHLHSNNVFGVSTAGLGYVNSGDEIIEIHKKNKEDYKKVEDWIKSIREK